MSPRWRVSLALAWLALLLLSGWWISQQLQLSGDLRKFMPAARTPEQKLLIDELGEGPGSRLLLLAISGDRPEVLARQSSALVAALAGHPDFSLATDGGAAGLESIYRLRSTGTRQRWTLVLTPTATDLASRLQAITLYGQGAELRCIETRMVEPGPPQRTLLASAARAATDVVDSDGLARLCHQGVRSR